MTLLEIAAIILLGFAGAQCTACAPVIPEPTADDTAEMAAFLASAPSQPEILAPIQGDCDDRPLQSGATYSDCDWSTVHIYGMGRNGEDPAMLESATQTGHTSRAQDAAPHHIVLERIRFSSTHGIPVYLGPGVHHVAVRDCVFTTSGESVAVYLDAESADNQITGNNITHQSTRREVIAVDGSARNFIQGNTIARADHGGIYVYRNCGEDGVPRHQAPTHNVISGNSFPAGGSIIVGSRQGNRGYCWKDDDRADELPGTSAASNLDWAQFNSVSRNPGAHVTVTQEPNYVDSDG